MEELRRCAVRLLLLNFPLPCGRTEADVTDVAKTLPCWVPETLNSMTMGPSEGNSETSLMELLENLCQMGRKAREGELH
jgi:hypothetical protein